MFIAVSMKTIGVERHLRTFGTYTKGLENQMDMKLLFIHKIIHQIGMPSLFQGESDGRLGRGKEKKSIFTIWFGGVKTANFLIYLTFSHIYLVSSSE
jgi:hypothetical protein